MIQGTTLSIVAKWLNAILPEDIKPSSTIEKYLSDIPKSSMQEFEILSHFQVVNKRIVDRNFPKSAFIVMIKRNGECIRPGGSTEIQAGDVLMVLADSQEDFEMVGSCVLQKV